MAFKDGGASVATPIEVMEWYDSPQLAEISENQEIR